MRDRDEEQREFDRQKQQAEIDARHEKEATVRPNSLHRVLIWLLKETAANNRDTTREANYYIDLLDRELADQNALEALRSEPTKPAAIAPTPVGGGAAPPPVFDTATKLRTSRRFGKGTAAPAEQPAAAPPTLTKAAVAKAKKTGQPVPVKTSSRFR